MYSVAYHPDNYYIVNIWEIPTTARVNIDCRHIRDMLPVTQEANEGFHAILDRWKGMYVVLHGQLTPAKDGYPEHQVDGGRG